MNSWIVSHKNVLKTIGITYDFGVEGSLSLVLPWMVNGHSAMCLGKWMTEQHHNRPILEYSNAWVESLAFGPQHMLTHLSDLSGIRCSRLFAQ